MKATNTSRQKPSTMKRKPTTARKGGTNKAKVVAGSASAFAATFFGGAVCNPIFTPRRKKLKGWQKELRRKGKISRYN